MVGQLGKAITYSAPLFRCSWEPDDIATVVQEGFQDLPAQTEYSGLWNWDYPADNPVGGATCQPEQEDEDLHCLTPAMVLLLMQQSEEGVEGFSTKAEIRSGVRLPIKKDLEYWNLRIYLAVGSGIGIINSIGNWRI